MKIRQFKDLTHDEALKNWLIEKRRLLHQHAELSEQEYKTQSIIVETLEALKIPYKVMADTGVMAIINGEDDGLDRCVGVRADIDALPLKESHDRSYHALNEGVMHACGHDAHTAILLGCAYVLNEMRGAFSGCVKCFFQPAEETVGGAERMVKEGCMQNPKVDAMLGLHVMPYLPVGEIEVRDGKLNAASDTVSLEVFGEAAHGAYPEKGVDAMTLTAELILGIQTILNRRVSPLDQVVISFGKINGGIKNNIICDHIKVTGAMRTTDERTRVRIKEMLTKYVENTAVGHGGRAEISFESGYKALVNDIDVNRVVRAVAQNILGTKAVHEKETPSLGVEDYSFFLDDAKGAFYHLGCGNISKDIVYPLHSKEFDIDEDVLITGVNLQINMILNLLGEEV